MVVYQQLQFIQKKNLGYDKDQLIRLPLDRTMKKNIEVFRTEFTKHASINSVTASSETVTNVQGGYTLWGEGKPDNYQLDVTAIAVEKDFLQTVGLELVAGEDFTLTNYELANKEDYEARVHTFIFNEQTVKQMGWTLEEAIGKKIDLNGRKGSLVGVAKDFHFASLHAPIQPLVIFMEPNQLNTFMVNFNPENTTQVLAHMENVWSKTASHRPFDYQFLDEAFNRLYNSEQRMGEVFSIFALIAIFIACLGLFGLASFTATQRAKEIGIRKVLGASVASVLLLFSKDFSKLILIAFVIATPLAYYTMQYWLSDFAFRISIGIELPIIAGIITLSIAWLTVGYHSIRTSLMNPIKSLRDE